MRILHIFTIPVTRNGVVMFALDRAQALLERGISLDFAALNEVAPDLRAQIEGKGIALHRIAASRSKKSLQYIRELSRLIRKNRYDIVHCHGNSATLFTELLAARLGGCKVRVAHCHNTTCRHLTADRRLRPFFYRMYTHAVACGTDAGKWLFPGRAFRVLPNGAALGRFAFDPALREEARRQLGLDGLVLGHVGRFNGQKNHAFLMQVFSELKKLRPDAKLLLVGDGYLMNKIREAAQNSGLADSVLFAGSVPDVERYLAAMDVMALPSFYEGFPTVLLEWQASGLPSLVSDKVTREIALTDLVRYRSLEESPRAWAEALLALPQPDRTQASEAAGHILREAGYDLSEGARLLEAFYREICPEK